MYELATESKQPVYSEKMLFINENVTLNSYGLQNE